MTTSPQDSNRSDKTNQPTDGEIPAMSAINENAAQDMFEGPKERVMVDLYPAEAVADSRRDLVWAVAWLAWVVAMIGGAVHYVRTGELPALMEHYGHSGWLVGGALAGLFVLHELPNAVSNLSEAIRRFELVRDYAATVALMPLSERLHWTPLDTLSRPIGVVWLFNPTSDLDGQREGGERR
jgi:hypothetical protein